MIPIHTLARVPGATETTEWTAICHWREPIVLIWHDMTYEVSRWDHRPRKRPFAVSYCKRGPSLSEFSVWSRHATLAAAEKAARKLAKEDA